AEPAASRTANRLKENGFNPVVYPLFELADTGQALPANAFSGVIFTSANAVRVLETRNWRNSDPEHIAYCVGETTRKAAEKIGFSRFVVANGGDDILVPLPNRLDEPPHGRHRVLFAHAMDHEDGMFHAFAVFGHHFEAVSF
ncbi:MAG: uroporphyrinogen-III synthase, partial [Pseudomonadota bacterium]